MGIKTWSDLLALEEKSEGYRSDPFLVHTHTDTMYVLYALIDNSVVFVHYPISSSTVNTKGWTFLWTSPVNYFIDF